MRRPANQSSWFKARSSLAVMLLAAVTVAQAPAPELRGSWTATAGSETFHGSWGAEISRRTPDFAQGYWTLLNDADERVMEGSWSARKIGSHWHGRWTAHIERGRSFSGSWDADEPESPQSKDRTFVDLLTRTLEKDVSGSWRSGSYGGTWSLRGIPPKNASH